VQELDMKFDDACFSSLYEMVMNGSNIRMSFDAENDLELANTAVAMLKDAKSGNYSTAIDAFLRGVSLCPDVPEPMMDLALQLSMKSNRCADLARPLLQFAEVAAGKNRLSLALESVKKVYNVTGSGHKMEMFYEPQWQIRVANVLEKIAQYSLHRCSVPYPVRNRNRRPRIAFHTINLNECATAWVKTAVQFARYAPDAGYDVYAYFTDECVARPQESKGIKFDASDSWSRAPNCLAKLHRLGSVVKCVPAELDWYSGALWLAEEMERDEIDSAIFQGSLGTPMMWLGSRLTRVPTRITLCVGLNMFQIGQAATVYMSNSLNMERERAYWRPEWGRQVYLPGGVDLEEASETPSLSRADFSIPSDAVTFGILSNAVTERVTPEYLSCVVRVLRECPNSIFVCMGPGEPLQQIQYMEEAGLLPRCRWLSWLHVNAFASLKLLDFYFNEFPVGGSQSLIECMACGKPVTAMRYGERHPESVGADIAGAEFAIMERDLDAYAARAIEWANDTAARLHAADVQQKRVKSDYSAKDFIRQLCHLASEGNHRIEILSGSTP
jgi:glycosyltransferase involved in cell wall biosynthesis